MRLPEAAAVAPEADAATFRPSGVMASSSSIQGSRLLVLRMVRRMASVSVGVNRSEFSRALTGGRGFPDPARGVNRASSVSMRATCFLALAAASRACFASGVSSSRSWYSTPATNDCMA